MACYLTLGKSQNIEQRTEVVKKALTRLEKALTESRVKVKISPTGAIAFDGWKQEDRDDLSDVCAFRLLSTQNSWALRQAVAKAEMLAGRKVSQAQVAAGTHSHDGGRTWDKGH